MATAQHLVSIGVWLIVCIAMTWLLCVFFSKKFYKKTTLITSWGCRVASFLGIYIIVRVFFFEIYHVNGHSMNPTLVDGDYVLVSKISYGTRLPRSLYEIPWINLLTYFYPFNLLDHKPTQQYIRLFSKQDINKGDIVVFNIPVYQKMFGIKRCVYIPGDTIPNDDTFLGVLPHNNLCINMCRNSLSKMDYEIITHYHVCPHDSLLQFSHNYYFLLGDNRGASTDSRIWGAVQDDHIVGKAKFIIFSKDKNGKFRWNRFFNLVK